MIDFQRDFVYPGGFGEALGNDTSSLLKALPPAERVLKACRAAGIFVIHTREGHRADLSDLPPRRTNAASRAIHIGDAGPMGRILVRGEYGHDIVEEVYPIDGEPVVDKPGKGAFYATDLDAILKTRGIQQARSSAASPPRSASRRASARRTTAATTRSSCPTAWARTSRSSSGWRWR